MTTDETTDRPNVLVTGAAGRLGSRVSSLLHSEGFAILATDVVDASEVPYRFDRADLLDYTVVLDLLEGIDVVLHIGNHPGIGARAPQQVFNENVSMNQNVFQGAAEQGVDRVVFASTLQLIGSHIDDRTIVNEPDSLHYPLHGGTPPDPSNVYALSKTVSELMLRHYARRCEIDAVALRFPLLHDHEERIMVRSGEERSIDIMEGFSGLSYDDAAALFLAVLRADLPGYRVYMPGTTHRHRDLEMAELIRAFYPGLPESMPDLIDIAPIVAETGWRLGPGYRTPRQS